MLGIIYYNGYIWLLSIPVLLVSWPWPRTEDWTLDDELLISSRHFAASGKPDVQLNDGRLSHLGAEIGGDAMMGMVGMVRTVGVVGIVGVVDSVGMIKDTCWWLSMIDSWWLYNDKRWFIWWLMIIANDNKGYTNYMAHMAMRHHQPSKSHGQ